MTAAGANVFTASVLFTDMVASTALRARLGDEAADDLFAEHDAMLDAVIELCSGRLVKRLGDGVFATFSSAAHAFEAAATIQRRVERFRARRPQHGFALRVGIAAGDVLDADGDVTGLPVVEAARLCASAQGDEVLSTDLARALVGSRTAFTFSIVGEMALHGLPDAITVHRMEWRGVEMLDDHGVAVSPLLVSSRTPYAGRAGLVSRLTQHWSAALGGGSSAVLLSGEAGIGKTRTAGELARHAAADGAVVLYGRCVEDLGAPYQPFVEALDSYVRSARAPQLGRLARELTRIVPDLPDLVAGVGTPLQSDPRTEEYRLHEAVASWLMDCSRDAGLMLVLDDLHWADATTLSLLLHVVRSIAHSDARVLVIGTLRDTDTAADAALTTLLAELRRLPGSLHLPLRGLDEGEVRELLAAAAGHPLDEQQAELAGRVHRECDGNPFFVNELVRHLIDTGAMAQVDGRWQLRGADMLDVPPSIRDVVARRLGVLSADAIEVLRAAAVLGRDFDLDMLAALTDRSADAVLDLLEQATAARLVEEIQAGEYRFSHALVHSTLYDAMSATRRRVMHRRAATVLEGSGELAALAHHGLRASMSADDRLQALQWAVAAGEQALGSRAVAEAEQRLHRALAELDAVADADDDRHLALRARVLCLLGEAQRDLGDQRFRATLADASSLADALGDTALVVRATLADDRGTTMVAPPQPERVRRVERALSLIGPEPSVPRAQLLARLVGELTFSGDTARRRRLTVEADAMARHLDDRAAMARVMIRTSMASHMLGSWRSTLERAERNVSLAREVGDPALQTTALSWLAASQIVAGELTQAEETTVQMSEAAAEASPSMRWFARMSQIKFGSLRGEFDWANAENNACFEIATALREPDAEAIWAGLAGSIAMNAGTTALLADVAATYADRNPTMANWRAGHAAFLAEAGRLDEARDVLARYQLDPDAMMEEPFAYHGPWMLATAAQHTHDVRLAYRVQRLLAPHRGRWSHVYLGVLGPVRWALGRCAVTVDALDIAVADLGDALAEARRANTSALVHLIALDLAYALAVRGHPSDRGTAHDLLDEIADRTPHVAERLGQIRETLAS
jgi:class 3 adenylate cyclase